MNVEDESNNYDGIWVEETDFWNGSEVPLISETDVTMHFANLTFSSSTHDTAVVKVITASLYAFVALIGPLQTCFTVTFKFNNCGERLLPIGVITTHGHWYIKSNFDLVRVPP